MNMKLHITIVSWSLGIIRNRVTLWNEISTREVSIHLLYLLQYHLHSMAQLATSNLRLMPDRNCDISRCNLKQIFQWSVNSLTAPQKGSPDNDFTWSNHLCCCSPALFYDDPSLNMSNSSAGSAIDRTIPSFQIE